MPVIINNKTMHEGTFNSAKLMVRDASSSTTCDYIIKIKKYDWQH
jgi:hypothetical protein